MVWSKEPPRMKMSDLHALAPAFADIDRRCEAQGGLQGLDGRCGLCFPVEKRGLRLYVARRGGLAARNANLVDPERFEDGGRIGIVRRRMLRREQEDRHRHGEDSDGYMAVQARKGSPTSSVGRPTDRTRRGRSSFVRFRLRLVLRFLTLRLV